MIDVLVDVARSFDVLHQVDAVACERAMNALQEVQRLALIVHGIERRDEVKRLGFGRLVEFAEVGRRELDVLQAPGRSLVTRGLEWLPSRGPFPRSGSSGTVRPIGSACDRCRIRIEPSQAARELLGQTRNERQDMRFE